VVHDDEVAKAAAIFDVGIVKAVDHRHAVALLIGQARTHQFAEPTKSCGRAIFHHMALNRRLFDHVGIIHIIHVRHAAFWVAGRQIAAEQIILFGCRPWAACADHQIGVAPQYFALRGVGLEFIGADANRYTGLTIEAPGVVTKNRGKRTGALIFSPLLCWGC